MSHYQAAIARIQEIESRLGIVVNPPAPPVSSSAPGAVQGLSSKNRTGLTGTAGGRESFDIILGAKSGKIKLQTLTSGGPPFAPYIEVLINRYAGLNGISPALVRAMIRQESDGNKYDVSDKGAKGLMQLMPEEMKELGVTDPFDPEQNIAAGTRLMAGLLKQYKGDVPLALAAYNAGSGAVEKYKGIPPFHETQGYIRNITKLLGGE